MKILLDLQCLQSTSRLQGVGRYSRALAEALFHNFGNDASAMFNLSLGDDITFNANRRWLHEHAQDASVHMFRGLTRIEGRNATHADSRRAGALCYDAYVSTLDIDIVHVAAPFDGYDDNVVAGWGDIAGPARAATVFDLSPFQPSDSHLGTAVNRRWYRMRRQDLARADVLLAVSEAARAAAINKLGVSADRVVNIGSDCDPKFKKVILNNESRERLLRRYGISKPFIIHAGHSGLRESPANLVRAFAALSSDLKSGHQLLMIGELSDSQREEIATATRKANLDTARVIVPGPIPDEDLTVLYGLTRVAVVQSTLDGFSLPLLEAMRCGAPVLCADAGSLPEIVGSKELLFDANRTDRLAAQLSSMLADDGFRSSALQHCDRRQGEFSWRKTAAAAHGALVEAVARRRAGSLMLATGRRKYVLVPRSDMLGDPVLHDAIAQLGRAGEVVVALPSDAQSEPAIIGKAAVMDSAAVDVSADHRIVVVGTPESLDANQRSVLAAAPAVIVKSEAEPPATASVEVMYRMGGYPAMRTMQTAGRRQFTNGCSYPNVMAMLGGGPGLADRIESARQSHSLGIVPLLIDRLRKLKEIDLANVAIAIAENHQTPIVPRLLVDLSALVRRDAGSGIQRVVKAVLSHLFTEKHAWRIEPIYRDGEVYRYARNYSCRFLNLNGGELDDDVVDFYPSDTFLGLDLDAELTEPASNVLRHHKRRGMRVIFIVYDLLPILRAEWFDPRISVLMTEWLHKVTATADHLIAISQSVADDIVVLLDRLPDARANVPAVSWWHLGSDFMTTAAQAPAASNAVDNGMLSLIEGRLLFLTVGTIEPRKGIRQLLDAADDFWRNHDATFVVVGSKGWLVDDLIERIKSHPELGKRLFWFDHPDDAVLDRLYGLATAALLPSEGEGFGLPLIEAVRRKTPVIARDIPVFREIGGSHVFYFTAKSGAELSDALRSWVALHKRGEAPRPEVEVATWRESTEQLIDIVRNTGNIRTATSKKP